MNRSRTESGTLFRADVFVCGRRRPCAGRWFGLRRAFNAQRAAAGTRLFVLEENCVGTLFDREVSLPSGASRFGFAASRRFLSRACRILPSSLLALAQRVDEAVDRHVEFFFRKALAFGLLGQHHLVEVDVEILQRQLVRCARCPPRSRRAGVAQVGRRSALRLPAQARLQPGPGVLRRARVSRAWAAAGAVA